MTGILSSQRFGSSAPGATTTWNPADKGSNIALTNGDLTATKTTNVAFTAVRATSGKNSGQWYFEWLSNGTGPGAGSAIVGLVGGSELLTNYIGQTNGVGYQDFGRISRNGSVILTGLGNWKAATSLARCAVDLTAQLVWFGELGDDWNANPSADPSTGVGGIDISALPGTLFPGCSLYDNGAPDSLTGNFGQTLFAGAVPSGFNPWG